MSQPQFLYPAKAQFRLDNLVLHATARRHVVNQFAGPLSIKTVIRGEVRWNVNGRGLLVDSSSFLILGEGERYSMNIDSVSPTETCCVFFRTGFVEESAHDAMTPLQASLDSPWRGAPSLESLSRLHSDVDRLLLPRVWSLGDRCRNEIQPSSFEEEFLVLAQQILGLYEKIRLEISRVPAAKLSTKKELFRRLQIAREYLHGNIDRRVSLEEISREACLSRYHLIAYSDASFD